MTITAKALVNSQYMPAGATALYVCPASTHTIIDKLTIFNSDSGAQTATVYLVPSGANADGSNMILSAVSISAGAVLDASSLQNQILNSGDAITVVASVANKLSIRVSGREIV